MSKNYIASTLTNAQEYTVYNGINAIKSIRVNGGHGLNNRHLITLNGAITEVSDEDLGLLRANPLFQRHVDNGFLTVTGDNNGERVAGNLESRDSSAPMNQNDVDDLMEDVNLGVTLDFDDPTAASKKKRA
jgi:hypothetical protein